MLLNSWHTKMTRNGKYGGGRNSEAAVALICFILGIRAVTSLARVDNNWSQRKPNMTVAQNHFGQAGGYRPQPLVYNRNQTFGHQQTTVRPGASGTAFRNNQTLPIRNQSTYPRHQGALNQTQTNWGQSPSMPQYPAHSQNSFNNTRIGWPQPQPPKQPAYPAYGQTSHNYTYPSVTPRPIINVPVGPAYANQSRPAWPQPTVPQNPAFNHATLNQTRPAWPQPSVPYVPQNPAQGHVAFNKSQPSAPQPSAPQLPNYPYNPALPASNLYPQLPNNPNTKPVAPSSSWTLPANQTHLYPQLPNQNLPQPGNSNGIPLAPLQPQTNPQGPHNWHSGGQSALSYAPGYYPPAAANTNRNPSNPQGSSNPYANMFI